MLKTFDCPKCGAPVDREDVIGANLTARCPYCDSALSVPDEMRRFGRPALSQINIQFGTSKTSSKSKSWVWLVVIVLLIAVILVPLLLSRAVKSISSLATTPVKTKPGGEKNQPPPFATQALKFGTEGIGPGMFMDARSIAIDTSGTIYVGEYIGGRIQVFDREGKFITQWSIDPKMPLRGLAADRKGIVYVVQSGKISRHEGQTGKVLDEVGYAGGWGFDDVTATADGGLIAAWYKNRDDIVRFDSAGEVVRTIQAAISSASGDSELNTRVAVDGLGNIYALGGFNNAVFKFGPDGRFVTRFGSAGDQPGQFRAASAIAIDGKGRVYVSDIKGVQVFDGNGRYLTVIKPEGMAFGMVFNDKNELFIAARKHVLKLLINQP
jgi:DNA-binding beta-propeller fold protein YncE